MARDRVTRTSSAIYPEATPAGSVAQRTFDTLLDEIMEFRLKPFELISEKAMSEALGVSRTPVREALARLASLGLIDIYAQRGSVVAPLRLANLRKSQFLREALEVGLITRAIESPQRGELVQKLKDELALQDTLMSISDDQRFFKSDELFHQHIAAYAGFPGIWADISAAKLHMDRFRHLSFPRMDSIAAVLDQHRTIAAAIERGDSQAAEEAMRSHLRRIFSVLDKVQERYPEYFSTSALPEPSRIQRFEGDLQLGAPVET
ncbi:GntR family transcriptional regulator [Kaistia granuli]|uniref:GntR family transcriptional regulator n=1 Tax=Kaistia granuli TaxID=363259 RepID=UPI000365FD7D|nr:GntR family transcriptional regulator [Kaistia granuli]